MKSGKKTQNIEKKLVLAINDYFSRYLSVNETGVLITITDSYLTPDLDIAKLYVDLWSGKELDRETFWQKVMQVHHPKLKRYVAKVLRHKVPRVPKELRFLLGKASSPTASSKNHLETPYPPQPIA